MSTSKHRKKKSSAPPLPPFLLPALGVVLLLVTILLLGRLGTSTSPGTEPTLPTPEANPYQPADFAYDGAYLTCTTADTKLGIDVSEHQPIIDWEAVKAAGVEYVMIRAGYRGYTEGQIFRDSCFESHLAGARAAGLDVGVYFFSQAVTPEEAAEEARFLLSVLGGQKLEIGVAFDWEFVSGDARTAQMDGRTLTDCAITFCEAVAKKGYDPIVYFNQDQAENMYLLEELTDYSFWLAMYTDQMTFPYKVDLWQYTEDGAVPGIEGNVDVNLYLP